MRCAFCGSQIAQAACSGCLALVPAGAKHCPMCGQALEKPQETAAPVRPCPGCTAALGSVQVGPYALRPCGACGGIWMDRHAFETLARSHENRDVFLESAHGSGQKELPPQDPMDVRYRSCPTCGKLMNRQNYARISGVVIDSCREDGFWFDRDELRKVVLFIEAGGLDRAARREREQRPSGGSGAEPMATVWGPDDPVLVGTTLPGRVGEVLVDAVGWALKLLP